MDKRGIVNSFFSLEAGFENLNPEFLAPVSAMSAPKELR